MVYWLSDEISLAKILINFILCSLLKNCWRYRSFKGLYSGTLSVTLTLKSLLRSNGFLTSFRLEILYFGGILAAEELMLLKIGSPCRFADCYACIILLIARVIYQSWRIIIRDNIAAISGFFFTHKVYLPYLTLLEALLSDYFFEDITGKMVLDYWGLWQIDSLDVAANWVALRSDVLEEIIGVFLCGGLWVFVGAIDVHEDDGFSLTWKQVWMVLVLFLFLFWSLLMRARFNCLFTYRINLRQKFCGCVNFFEWIQRFLIFC